MASRRQTAARPEPTLSDFERACRHAEPLRPQTGLSAVKGEYRPGVALKSGYRHTASIDLDADFLAREPAASRWDYGLGLRNESGQEVLIWLEAHPASSTGEVQKMLDKLAWLKQKLDQPAFESLRRLEHKIAAYRWLAMTGPIRILPNSVEARRLAKVGLSQPQRRVELP